MHVCIYMYVCYIYINVDISRYIYIILYHARIQTHIHMMTPPRRTPRPSPHGTRHQPGLAPLWRSRRVIIGTLGVLSIGTLGVLS